MIYDNWHTATCMKCCSDDSTSNLAQMAQNVSLMLFKAELTPLKYPGVFPQWMSPHDIIEDYPNVAEVFSLLYLGIGPFIQLFLMILA